MKVINIYIIMHIESIMGDTYKNLRKIYECVNNKPFPGESYVYFLEIIGSKGTKLNTITHKEFLELKDNPII